jgi:hypothetical protein
VPRWVLCYGGTGAVGHHWTDQHAIACLCHFLVPLLLLLLLLLSTAFQQHLQLLHQLLLFSPQRLLQRMMDRRYTDNVVDLGLRQLQGCHLCPPEVIRWLLPHLCGRGSKPNGWLQCKHGRAVSHMLQQA